MNTDEEAVVTLTINVNTEINNSKSTLMEEAVVTIKIIETTRSKRKHLIRRLRHVRHDREDCRHGLQSIQRVLLEKQHMAHQLSPSSINPIGNINTASHGRRHEKQAKNTVNMVG